MNILEALGIDPDTVPHYGCTTEQRRALYRMGRSRSWIKKYAATKEAASRCIDRAIAEMSALKTQLHHVRQ